MESKGSILVISANPDLQAGCQQALGARDLLLQAAHSVQEGLSMAGTGKFDILLLDATALPNEPEATDLPILGTKDGDPVSLILSGRSDLPKALRAVRAGAYDVIQVPVIPDLLLLSVTRALDNRRQSLELKRLYSFEQDISRLWAVAEGELDNFEEFDKNFLARGALRLTVAHEFRAPLTALQSFLMLLLKGFVPPEQRDQYIRHALDRSQGLLELVDDLMDLATARQDLSTEKRSRVLLGDELTKVIPTLKAAAEEKRLELALDMRRNPRVEVNPSQMGPLWVNLISNAIKYTPPGGRIRVSLDQDEKWAIGTVEDNGIGIDPKDQALIFHEFYRALPAKKMEFHGTGLGLPLVKRITEGYGGKVEVESALGKGSLFRITLPLAASGEPDPP